MGKKIREFENMACLFSSFAHESHEVVSYPNFRLILPLAWPDPAARRFFATLTVINPYSLLPLLKPGKQPLFD